MLRESKNILAGVGEVVGQFAPLEAANPLACHVRNWGLNAMLCDGSGFLVSGGVLLGVGWLVLKGLEQVTPTNGGREFVNRWSTRVGVAAGCFIASGLVLSYWVDRYWS